MVSLPSIDDTRKNHQPRYSDLRRIVLEQRNIISHGNISPFARSKPFSESLEDQKKRIQNEGLAQENKLRKTTLFILFGFLAIETAAIFVLAFFQGFEVSGFHLEEWSFKLVVLVTISQITTMLLVAVKYLFPKRH